MLTKYLHFLFFSIFLLCAGVSHLSESNFSIIFLSIALVMLAVPTKSFLEPLDDSLNQIHLRMQQVMISIIVAMSLGIVITSEISLNFTADPIFFVFPILIGSGIYSLIFYGAILLQRFAAKEERKTL